MAPGRERRRSPRAVTDELVRLNLMDQPGGITWMQARCVSISKTGLQVEVSKPLPPNARVAVEMKARDIRVTAVVRYIRPNKMKYLVGLECVWGDQLPVGISEEPAPVDPA